MNYYFINLKNILNFDFFLIFVAAMSFVVCVVVKARGRAPQSHQQAPKTEKETKLTWSEADFRKVFLDYRRMRVVFRLAASSIRTLLESGKLAPERRRRLAVRGYTAYLKMKELANQYNEMSKLAIEKGSFPSDLPKILNV